MATRTVATFQNDTVRFEIDIDDGNNRVTAFRCINSTDQAALGQLIRISDGRLYAQRFPPGTTFIDIPGNSPAARLDLTYDADRDRYDGVDIQCLWPYP